MRRNISQLRAISYAAMEQKRKKQAKYIEEHGWALEFKSSKYHTTTWFLKSKGVNIY